MTKQNGDTSFVPVFFRRERTRGSSDVVRGLLQLTAAGWFDGAIYFLDWTMDTGTQSSAASGADTGISCMDAGLAFRLSAVDKHGISDSFGNV